MLDRLISNSLLILCGAGLFVAWMPDRTAWRGFEVLVLACLIVWLICWVAGRGAGAARAAWSPRVLPLAAVALWGAVQLSMGWSAYPYATRVEVVRWAVYAAVFFLAFQSFGDERNGGRFRAIAAIYGLAMAVVSIFQHFLGNGKIFWLFETAEHADMGPFLNYDHFASFVALVLPCALVEMLRRRDRRWLFGMIAAVLYASVVAGTSRAGSILVTLELLFLVVVLKFSPRLVGALVALAVGLGFVVGWGALYDRLRLPDPYAGRREVAAASVEMCRAKPLKGHGLGTFTLVYPAYAQKDLGAFVNAAHNDWLEWTADGGAPMLLLMLIIAGGAASLVKRVPWAVGVPVVFLHGLIDFPMQGRFLPATVFLLSGIAARAAYDRRQSIAPAPGRG